MGRRLALSVLAAAFVVAPAPAVAQPADPRVTLVAVSLQRDGAYRLLEREGGAIGLGLYPDSRAASRFFDEVAAGAPRARAGLSSPLAGKRCALGDLLASRGALPRLDTVGASPGVGEALERMFCTTQPRDASRVHLAVAFPRVPPGPIARPTLVFGLSPATPLVVGVIGRGRGVLDGGVARRPQIVTPYDVAATVLDMLGIDVPAEGFTGRALRVKPSRDPLAATGSLATRLVRDADYGPAVAAATIGVLFGGGIALPIVLLLLWRRGERWALRAARGAATAVTGYVASLFVPTSNAGLRSIPIVAAFVLGALMPLDDARRCTRQIGVLLGISSTLIAVVTVAAALNPGGEPALSLYGNPLVSWRLYGLRNHLTSMLAMGVLTALAVAPEVPNPKAIALAGALGVFVVGASFLGANFVAVLTLAFGAALVTYVVAKRHVTISGVVVSGALAVLAFALALLADAGSPASHGGQAVQRVRSGGLDAAIDFVRIRWRLNVGLIGDISGGWVWTALLVAGLVCVVVWCLRDETLGTGARAAMLGGSASALAAIFMEDTGLLAGGVIALAPGLVAATVIAERALRPARAGAAASERTPRTEG